MSKPFATLGTKNETPAVRQEALAVVDNMIQLVRSLIILRNRELGFTICPRSDLEQDILIHLWTRCLPQYDTDQAKLSTYCYVCVQNYITSQVRAYGRKRNRQREISLDTLLNSPHSCHDKISWDDISGRRDEAIDLVVEREATRIIQNAHFLLPRRQARLLRALADNQGMKKFLIAKHLMRQKRTSSLSMLLSRLKCRILEITDLPVSPSS